MKHKCYRHQRNTKGNNYNSIDPLTFLFLQQQHLMNINIYVKYVKIHININQDMQEQRVHVYKAHFWVFIM